MDPVESVLFDYLRDVIYKPAEAQLDMEKLPENFREFAQGLQYFTQCVMEAKELALSLSKGDLTDMLPSRGNEIAAPLKSLHASLKHLTWQAQQIAKGDYQQRVSFMGDFASAFNSMAGQLEERRKIDLQEKSELQQYLNMILSHSPTVIIVFDTKDKAVLASDSYYGVCNTPSDEVQGKGVSELFDCLIQNDFLDNISTLFDLVREGRTTLTVEHELALGQDGEVRLYIIRIVPLFRNDETFMGTMLIFDDVTEIIHVRRVNEHQLAKLNLMVRGTKIGLWDMDVRQDDISSPENIFTWSNEFRQMLGFADENDFPNDINSWTDRLHPEDKDGALAALTAHLLDTSGKTPFDVECRLLKKDGEYSYYRTTGETIRDEDGLALYLAGALMDITEAKNVLLDTDRQRLEAQAANRAKNEFMARMSHEMRTPMNAIMGMVNIGINAKDNNRRDYCFHSINKAAQHLLFVINQVLDMSEIEVDDFKLLNSEFNFIKAMENINSHTEMQTREKKQSYTFYIDPAIPANIVSDEKRLTQVLLNLLSNAVKFTPELGEISLCAEKVREAEGHCTLRFIIKDNGVGIPEEHHERLFMPFEQVDGGTTRKYEGVGLGLAISKRIVEMMGGSIALESSPECGTVFTIEIEVETGEHTEETSADGIFADKRILIAEDVEINCEIVAALLENTGVEIIFAYNGVQAVEKFKAAPSDYDLIFMDIRMPEMDGYEASKMIRLSGVPESATIPIIAMTANASSDDIEMSFASGMDGHLCKPLDIEEVLRAMKQYLGT